MTAMLRQRLSGETREFTGIFRVAPEKQREGGSGCESQGPSSALGFGPAAGLFSSPGTEPVPSQLAG